MESTIEWAVRQAKKVSRPSQHLARWVRSGAIGVPSVEILGGGGEAEEVGEGVVDQSQPIVVIDVEMNLSFLVLSDLIGVD